MKICFVAQDIYPYFVNNRDIQTAGGAELQQAIIGRELSKRGCQISFIALDHGQPNIQEIESIKIYKSYKPTEGIYGFRFFYPKLYKTWLAMKRANADIYYVRSAGYLPGIVAFYCRIYNKKFVFAGAHETDFIPSKLLLTKKRDILFYKYGLRHADKIIVQSAMQKKLLWDNYRLKGTVISNCYPHFRKMVTNNDRKKILWVSTLRSWKRPMLYLKLAMLNPLEKFIMIGGKDQFGDPDLYDKVKKKAETLPNMNFLGYQPLDKTEEYFDNCKLFINTSEYEGFPNTFLQAWSRGIPVISYVDPDNAIQKNNLGFVVESETELQEALKKVLKENQLDRFLINNYFKKNHASKPLDLYYATFSNINN